MTYCFCINSTYKHIIIQYKQIYFIKVIHGIKHRKIASTTNFIMHFIKLGIEKVTVRPLFNCLIHCSILF